MKLGDIGFICSGRNDEVHRQGVGLNYVLCGYGQ